MVQLCMKEGGRSGRWGPFGNASRLFEGKQEGRSKHDNDGRKCSKPRLADGGRGERSGNKRGSP